MEKNSFRRKPIRERVLLIVLVIAMGSLITTSGVGIVSMLRIQDKSEAALTERMQNNLYNIAVDRAEYAESELGAYADYVQGFATYIHGLYTEPDAYVKKPLLSHDPKNAGKYVLQRAFANEQVSEEAVSEEASLISNTAQEFYPVISAHSDVIMGIYGGTESGFSFAYDIYSDKKLDGYYDHYSRVWYQQAKEEGKVCFTDVYLDSFGRGLTISCAAPFYDEKDQFAGVVAMDILISDLYAAILNLDLGDEEAYAFLVDNSGNVISPDEEVRTIHDDPDLDQATEDKILNGQTGVSLTEKGVYYAYTPVESVSWKLCIHVPQSYVLAPAREMDEQIMESILLFTLILVLIILIVTLFVQRFANSLTKPLIALSEDARIISGGDLEHRAQVFHNDEIGDVATNFNDMAIALKQYIEDLTAVTAEKERIGAELNVATQIQADMLPRIFPPFPERGEFDLYATMDPAKEVGGDFYDFFLIDNDHVGLVMADVSGKGVPAALFMVIAKTLIKNRALMGGSPSEVLSYANEQLCEGNEAELFVTVWFAILTISTGKGVAANAGHEHPAIRRAGGKYELSIYKHSPAVASMEGLRFREHEFELHPGDSLFVYTDGVAEATNAQDELYGTERMLEVLNRNPDAMAEEQLKSIKEDIDLFVGDAPQFDDITMLGFNYFGIE
ncbi:MAG: SpoIIE family protein phosphatase [Lachnospiraceae bacterium]|nr:SpoIIE family protein phosphatase [Lachnospiraceae bacterium]